MGGAVGLAAGPGWGGAGGDWGAWAGSPPPLLLRSSRGCLEAQAHPSCGLSERRRPSLFWLFPLERTGHSGVPTACLHWAAERHGPNTQRSFPGHLDTEGDVFGGHAEPARDGTFGARGNTAEAGSRGVREGLVEGSARPRNKKKRRGPVTPKPRGASSALTCPTRIHSRHRAFGASKPVSTTSTRQGLPRSELSVGEGGP